MDHISPLSAAQARQLRWQGYTLCGTVQDRLLNEVALVTARLFGASVALVSLADASQVWFRGQWGWAGPARVPRDRCLCAAALLREQCLVFEDLQRDPCTLGSAAAAAASGLRFYAAHALGALSIMAAEPRPFDAASRDALAQLAHLTSAVLALRGAAAEAHALPTLLPVLEQAALRPLTQLLVVANRWRHPASVSDAPAKWAAVAQAVRQGLAALS
ncbi:hypothetical protein GCM10027048_32220 [Hymenobacter coalescens]|uniref:GAF domain-containing protein n=1 Tax=Hymenobacter koreensis TaxID=1084523 RepID=A0ABP8JDC5_9BACT